MKNNRAGDGERTLAVFIDFENLALGFAGRRDRFQIEKVLERLVEKGKIVAKKAYCDWSRFGAYAGSLHECAIELIEIPKRSLTGKNSADIRLVVDAIDLAYSKDHIDTFVVVSGDSDFSPLVSKLKELGKHVIGLGLVDATSNLLRDNCDEFIYYEDLDRPAIARISDSMLIPESKRKVFALLMDSLLALRRENKDLIFSSMVKDTMKRKKPSFNEEYHGYRTFSDLLEDAQRYALIEIEKHKTSGTYVVLRFGQELRMPQVQQTVPAPLPARPVAAPVPQQLPAAPPVYRPEPPPTRPQPAQQQPVPQPPQQLPQPRPASPVYEQDRRYEERPPVRGIEDVFIPGQTPPTRPQQPAVRPTPPQPVVPPPAPLPPPKPAVHVKPPQPKQPLPKFPVYRDEVEDDDELPTLGRSLIDDVDEFDDDIDEVPSYSPGGAVRNPSRPAPAGRAGSKKPETAKPAAAKPAQAKPAKPAEPPKKKPVAQQQQPPAKPKPVPPPPVAPPPPPAPAKKPPVKKPPAEEDDGFGAGLD